MRGRFVSCMPKMRRANSAQGIPGCKTEILVHVFMLGWPNATRFMDSAADCTAGGCRRNRGGAAGAKAAKPSQCAGGKTGKRAADAPKSFKHNHRSSRTAGYFLSEYCDQQGAAEYQAEVRTFCR